MPEPRCPGYDYTSIDLELVNWYATETWRRLQHRMEAAELWKGPIFELALEHPAFMDAILTTAAIHKLVAQPDTPRRQAFIELIMEKGLRIIPAMVENLNAPSRDNFVVLLASTILVTIWAFGSISLPPQANLFKTPEFVAQGPSPMNHAPSSPTPRLDDFLTVVNFSTGTYNVVMTMRDEILNSGFSEMIAGAPWNDMQPPAQNVIYGLNALEAHAKSMCDEMNDELISEYIVQIQRLHQMFQATQNPNWHDIVVGFVIRLPKIMVQELALRKPLALTILAYWTAALKAADGTWWIHGWPRAVFSEVNEILDADWKSHLRIPAKFFD